MFSETGHKHAAGWLAGVSGESVGQALDVLKTAARLAETPVVEQAFKDGKLSLSQAGVAASAGAIDPSAQGGLVRTATSGSMRELKDEASRIKRAADGARGEASLALKEARAQRGRYLRTRVVPEGGMKLEAWLPTADGARIKAALKDEANRIFKAAWAAGVKERPDAYLADALVRAICGERKSEPKADVAVRVDLATLRRGFVEGDETCEIAGVGPIPVDVAKDLLGDAVFHFVVTDGVDVKAVTSKKRTIPASLRRALMERDRTCAVPGCDATEHLQIDHRWDFAKGGPTRIVEPFAALPGASSDEDDGRVPIGQGWRRRPLAQSGRAASVGGGGARSLTGRQPVERGREHPGPMGGGVATGGRERPRPLHEELQVALPRVADRAVNLEGDPGGEVRGVGGEGLGHRGMLGPVGKLAGEGVGGPIGGRPGELELHPGVRQDGA